MPGLLAAGAWLAVCSAGAQTTFTVSNTRDSGAGSLRQALLDANAAPGRDTIVFNIPGTGVQTITPSTALPSVTEAVVLDGSTQPGYAGTPLIQLVGSSAGSAASGLVLLGGNSLVRGLAINRFKGDGIRVQGPGGNVLQGNIIGADPAGTTAYGNSQGGITINQSSGNQVGGTNANEGNLISGGAQSGLYILGPAEANRVLGNRIGTDLSGKLKLGNTNNGVVISSAAGNFIGGVGAGASNVISGNGQSGVYLMGRASSNNVVAGNLLGTQAGGAAALGNAADGVTVYGAGQNILGGTEPGAGNVISGNGGRGVYLFSAGANSNLVVGNCIGTDLAGRAALSNKYAGVEISGVAGNVVGTTARAAGRNVISGNGQSGVTLSLGAARNAVVGNLIGADATGTRALANGYSGVNVMGPSNFITGNVISGNTQNGVYLSGTNAWANVVQGNFIGTDGAGSSAVSNLLSGVFLENAAANLIGGTHSGQGNLIAGNGGNGIYLLGLGASNNLVQGNYLGTDVTGRRALGNVAGIGITNAPGNVIGGLMTQGRNLISGNANSGIYLQGAGAAGNVIQGNWIGTDLMGTNALSNGFGGIYLYGCPRNLIGGPALGAGNLISGNAKDGISLGDPGAVSNIIQGNFIGTTIDGVSPLGNQWHNLELLNSASNNVIGGLVPGAANRIGFAQTALYAGVRVRSGCPGNAIRGNAIFGNAGLGIDVGANGPDPSGAPVLGSSSGRYVTQVQGSLSGVLPKRSYTLDFYVNSAPDPTGYGEGELWIGARSVTTDAAGKASFTVSLTNAVAVVGSITATATDPANTTSEFVLDVTNTPGAVRDTDGDGLPDDYELAWGFDPQDPSDAAADADGDGMSNLQEFLTGTNPHDPSDALRISTVQVSDGAVWLWFPTVIGKRYRVECAEAGLTGWRSVATNIAGIGNLTLVRDWSAAGASQRYYRVACP